MKTKAISIMGISILLAGRTSILAAGDVSPTNNVAPTHPNVLMIVIDDLNDWVGYLGGHPQARTPCLDALAASGTAFANAQVQRRSAIRRAPVS